MHARRTPVTVSACNSAGGPLKAGGRRRIKKLRRFRLFTPARLALLERIIHTYDTLYLDEVRDLFAEASGTWTSVSGPGHSGDRLHAQEGAIDRPVVLSACLFAICCFLRWALHAGP